MDNVNESAPPSGEVAALIERLRRVAKLGEYGHVSVVDVLNEAADALARLSAPVPDKPMRLTAKERSAIRQAIGFVLAGETEDFDRDAAESALGKLE